MKIVLFINNMYFAGNILLHAINRSWGKPWVCLM